MGHPVGSGVRVPRALVALLLLTAQPVAAALPSGAVPSAALPSAGLAPVLLVVDASGSMGADDGTGRPRVEAARDAVAAVVDALPADAPVGLRAYGHREPNTDPVAGCADTELLVPPTAGSGLALRAAVAALEPSGFSPIGASLIAAADDLPDVPGRTVVLVSDGIDTCAPPEACEVARDLVATGVDLRVEAIGFQVDDAAAGQLRCIAEATGGRYRPADDAAALVEELQAQVVPPAAVLDGAPVEGGPTAAAATAVGDGRHVDDLLAVVAGRRVEVQPEWYRVDVAPGQVVTATATVATDEPLPVPLELVLGLVDVLGVAPCDVATVAGLAPPSTSLAVAGLPATGGQVCTDPGTYALGVSADLSAVPEDARDALAGRALDLQLEVRISGGAAPTPTMPATAPVVALPAVTAPAVPAATPPRLYVGTVLAGLVVGGIGGIGLSRRLGP